MDNLKENHLDLTQYSVKPRENGDVLSPTQSCILSMSDSFVSQAHSLSERNYGLTGRSSTIDSFRSASSSEYESSTPTPTGTIRHRPNNKRPRPLSETWNNDMDTFSSDYVISCPLSSPNLINAETPTSAAQESATQPSKGVRHKMVRQDPVREPYDEKQRLLSSPKHSSSYPVLKKLSITETSSKQEEKDSRTKISNSVSHGNSDTILCRSDEINTKRITTSSSFMKQLGDKLKAPLKKGVDLTLAFRRSVENGDSDMKSPLTPPSPKGLVVHRSDLARGATIGTRDYRHSFGTGGAKAFLIQKKHKRPAESIAQSANLVAPETIPTGSVKNGTREPFDVSVKRINELQSTRLTT